MSAAAPAAVEAGLRARLAADGDDCEALIALAELLAAQAHDREAASLFRRALAQDANDARAQRGLGLILQAYDGYRDEAIALLQEALATDATLLDAYRPLAGVLNDAGRSDEAVATLRRWQAVDPGNPAAQHLLAAYSGADTPSRAADAFVRQTFDDGADHFDSLLRESLHYRAPEALYEHLLAAMPSPAAQSLDVLDMGCGTGLCAPLLRPLARQLVGVDLSPRMLAHAAARSGYDQLHCAELGAWLATTDAAFDLLFAADTLLYFGDLAPVLAGAGRVLRPGGWLAFTVEAMPDGASASGVELATSGRFRHSEAHVRHALAATAMTDAQIVATRLRYEAGAAVTGFAVVARQPTPVEQLFDAMR